MSIVSFAEMTLSETYRLISHIIIVVIVISLFLLLLILLKIHTRIARSIYTYFYRKPKTIIYIVVALIAVLFLIFLFIQLEIKSLDRATTVKVDEKIVIIEIDDYWNIAEDGAGPYLGAYGYTFERYNAVSDTLDKHGAVASLGVTPYIFEEYSAVNYALRDDPEMISYLKRLESKGYEISMHGYNHCRNENFCPKYEEVWYNIFKGKLELEDVLDTSIETYFPPGNTWTTEQYENVKKAGFITIGNTHVSKAYFDEGVIITPKGYDPIYYYGWYQLDFKHTPYEEWVEAYNEEDLFVLQLHCNTFDSQEKINDLDKFLDYIKKDGAKIMTYKEFHKHSAEKLREQDAPLSGNFVLKVDNDK